MLQVLPSERVAYFSICSLNYLHYARTLAQSLAQADPSAEFYLFIADRWDERVVAGAPELQAISLDELAVPGILDMAFRYTVLEFNTALKPFCIDYLFDRMGYGRVVYLDPDILVLKQLSHVTQALAAGAECVLTPHITQSIEDGHRPNEIDLMRAGVFNLGFAAFANKPQARRFIDWWRDKLATECLVDLERGIFVDQTYCNFAPAFIERTTILRHPGYNVAYWNIAYRTVTMIGDEYCVGSESVHFVHFSGVDMQNPDSVSRHQNRYRRGHLGDFGALYDRYLDKLRENDRGPPGAYSEIPYGFGVTHSGVAIEPWMRRTYASLFATPVSGGDPFSLPAHSWAYHHVAAAPEPVTIANLRAFDALPELIQLVQSPLLLLKSLWRIAWKGHTEAADYWWRRAASREATRRPPRPSARATAGAPLPVVDTLATAELEK